MKKSEISGLIAAFNTNIRKSAHEKSDDLLFIGEWFPKMQCLAASYLLAIHIFKNVDIESIDLIGGYCDCWEGEDEISHYWLELNGLLLDITADQYNLIEDQDLHQSFIRCRPFSLFYCIEKYLAPHSFLFVERERTRLTKEFDIFTRDGLREWEHEYNKLMGNRCLTAV